MHLVSLRSQTVHIGGTAIEFAKGESIWTESCHKYTPAQFAAVAKEANLGVEEVWTDKEERFSVQLLRPI
jgi:uncharacterized SAM-dependent methyltransferase